jgi:hypothetical protein
VAQVLEGAEATPETKARLEAEKGRLEITHGPMRVG